jgi:hypothetical protein
MAEGFSVPIATGLFGNINPEIARGVPVPDINNLAQSYKTGADLIQQYQLQNLFSGGLPRDASGNIDYNQIAEQLSRASGASAIPTLTALRQADIQQQAIKGLGENAPGIFGPVGQQQQPRPQLPPSINRTSAPAASYSATEDQSGDGVPRPPGQNLTSGQITGIDYGPTQTSFADRFAGEPTAQPDSRYPPQFRQGGDTGPATGSFQMAQAQAPQARAAPPPAPAQPLAPPGSPEFFSEANAAAYEAAARRSAYVATQLGVANMAPAATAAEKLSGQYSDTAKQIREAIAKRQELTPAMKEYGVGAQPGETLPAYGARAEGMKTIATEDIKDFNKENTAIQTAGRVGIGGQQRAAQMKQLTLDPNFYSGPFNEKATTYLQLKAIFGSNPSAATAVESFNKGAKEQLTEQIKSLGGSGVGRVLQSEVQNISQTLAGLGITPQTNRALAELQMRTYKAQADLADIARKIPPVPGQMMTTFNNAAAQYLRDHPIYSPQEKQNPSLLGAPDAPPQSAQWSPAQRRTWAAGIGLKPGDAIRFNGQIGAVP